MPNITTWTDLANIINDMAASYDLQNNLTAGEAGYSTLASATANANEGWIPLGDDVNRFTGILNLNGFSIEGFNINRSASDQGIFHTIGTGGHVHSGKISGSIENNDQNLGFIAGNNAGLVEGIVSNGTVTCTRPFGSAQVSGICGQNMEGGITQDCKNYATLVIPNNNSRVSGCGNIGAALPASTIRRCINFGVIGGDNSQDSANGVIGRISNDATQNQGLYDVYELSLLDPATDYSQPLDSDFAIRPVTQAETADMSTFTPALSNNLTVESIFDIVTEANHNGLEVTATWFHDGVEPKLWFEYDIPISGTITLSGNAAPDSLVDIFRAINPLTDDPEYVQSTISDVNGVYSTNIIRDPLYHYWASARNFIPLFTGNLSGGVAGSILTTSDDLSNESIGGPSDDLYFFIATGGTGVGQEVAILSKSGNDIDVGIEGLFSTDTTYQIGKAKFPGKLYPKESV